MMNDRTRYAAAAVFLGLLVAAFFVPVPDEAWQFSVVDDTAIGNFVDIVVEPDGTPHVAYMDEGGGVQYATRITTGIRPIDTLLHTYLGLWRITTVDDTSTRGHYLSLAMVDGGPAIAYKDNAAGNSKVMYAAAREDWQPTVVDSIEQGGVNVGMYTKLTAYQGRPIIFYHRPDGRQFSYALRQEGWQRSDLQQEAGWFTGAASCPDEVFVGYRERSTRGVWFGVFDGSWDARPLNTTTNAHIGVATQECRPYIAYFDRDQGAVRFADVDNGFATTRVGPGRLSRVSLAAGDGFHVVYHHYKEGLVYGSSDAGEVWDTHVIDAGSTEVEYNGVAVDRSETPHVAYTNSTTVVYAKQEPDAAETIGGMIQVFQVFLVVMVVVLLGSPLRRQIPV